MTADMITEMRATTSEIYDHMEDDLSKQIYKHRLLYNLTGDRKHILDIINISPLLCSYERNFKTEIIELKDKDIIVYGAGEMASLFLVEYENDVTITAFCDRNEDKQKNGFHSYPVIPPEKIKEKYANHHIIITPLFYSEIIRGLLEMGLSEQQIHIYSTGKAEIWEKLYFDDFVPQVKNEVFIDVGCFNGGTIGYFRKWTKDEYKKVIAFEPDATQYQVCLKNLSGVRNITLLQYGLWDKEGEAQFLSNGSGSAILDSKSVNDNCCQIETVQLDNVLKNENITFIKMDIEGAELMALKGAEQTIRQYKPKLAVSVYHKHEDIWTIPAYILSLNNGYNLYIRHYSYTMAETVLYAL